MQVTVRMTKMPVVQLPARTSLAGATLWDSNWLKKAREVREVRRAQEEWEELNEQEGQGGAEE